MEGRDQVVILVLGTHPSHVGAAEGIDPGPVNGKRRNLSSADRRSVGQSVGIDSDAVLLSATKNSLHLRCNSGEGAEERSA